MHGGHRGKFYLTYLATDELQVTSALSVTVSGTVLGTSLVGRVLAHTTVLVHGDEVEGTVKTAVEGRQVNIEGELVVHEGEHLVLVGAVHEVETGADVGAVLVLGQELESQGVTAGGGTVGRAVVGTLDLAVGRAALGVGAGGGVPLIAVVAVDVVALDVEPTPVGVDGHLGVDVSAAGGGTLLPGELGVSLGLLSADSLALGHCDEGSEGGKLGLHGDVRKILAPKEWGEMAFDWHWSARWVVEISSSPTTKTGGIWILNTPESAVPLASSGRAKTMSHIALWGPSTPNKPCTLGIAHRIWNADSASRRRPR